MKNTITGAFFLGMVVILFYNYLDIGPSVPYFARGNKALVWVIIFLLLMVPSFIKGLKKGDEKGEAQVKTEKGGTNDND